MQKLTNCHQHLVKTNSLNVSIEVKEIYSKLSFLIWNLQKDPSVTSLSSTILNRDHPDYTLVIHGMLSKEKD